MQHRREAALWAHLKDALAHEEALEKLKASRQKLEHTIADNETQLRAREDAIAERNDLRVRLDEVRLVVGQDSQAARLKEDRDRLARVQEELKSLRQAPQGGFEVSPRTPCTGRIWLRHGE